MPRKARELSESGYFHVIVRGNGQQQIFEENGDYKFFLKTLEELTNETSVTVCAYCLMGNHVHLLVNDEGNELPQFMNRLETRYAVFFNWKYGRSGHLFQGRYKSEPIEDDACLLWVFRYILRNPVKAGIGSADGYPWSSYRLYGGESFVDTLLIGKLLGDRENFARYIQESNDNERCGIDTVRISDIEAKRLISEKLGIESGSVIQSYERSKRDKAVVELINAGLSERQISRLTGISRYIIRHINW